MINEVILSNFDTISYFCLKEYLDFELEKYDKDIEINL